MRRGFIMDFIIAAVIFGFAAVWAVPVVSGFLSNILPTQIKSYLPASTKPAFTAVALGQATVFGVLLALILVLLRKVGIRKQVDGIEA